MSLYSLLPPISPLLYLPFVTLSETVAVIVGEDVSRDFVEFASSCDFEDFEDFEFDAARLIPELASMETFMERPNASCLGNKIRKLESK